MAEALSESINDRLAPGGLNSVAVVSTVGGVTSLVGPDGPISVGLPTDENGNIVANVIPRTGTLTSLLTTVAGGVNEVSYATDWDAAVIHNGVAGGARILYCKPKICHLKLVADSALTSGSMMRVALDSAAYDPYSLANLANTRIAVPSGTTHFKASGGVTFAANATGRRAMMITGSGSDAAVIGPGGLANAAVSHASAAVALIANCPPQPIFGSTHVALSGFQDSGGSLNAVSTPGPCFLSVEFWRES